MKHCTFWNEDFAYSKFVEHLRIVSKQPETWSEEWYELFDEFMSGFYYLDSSEQSGYVLTENTEEI